MMKQKTGRVVNIGATLSPKAYAVGAPSELRGEVMVLAGTAWPASPGDDDEMRVESTRRTDETATLLVTTKVEN